MSKLCRLRRWGVERGDIIRYRLEPFSPFKKGTRRQRRKHQPIAYLFKDRLFPWKLHVSMDANRLISSVRKFAHLPLGTHRIFFQRGMNQNSGQRGRCCKAQSRRSWSMERVRLGRQIERKATARPAKCAASGSGLAILSLKRRPTG